jgi:hypothetical protein
MRKEHVKLFLRAPCRHMGVEGKLPSFLTSALNEDEWSAASLIGRFTSLKKVPVPIRQEAEQTPDVIQ